MAVVSGHDLPATRVIWTVAPRFKRKYYIAALNALHACYRNSLEAAVVRLSAYGVEQGEGTTLMTRPHCRDTAGCGSAYCCLLSTACWERIPVAECAASDHPYGVLLPATYAGRVLFVLLSGGKGGGVTAEGRLLDNRYYPAVPGAAPAHI